MTEPARTQPATSRIDVSAELLSIEPGLYTVDLACPHRTQAGPTLTLPFISLTPMPHPAGDPGRAFISTLGETPIIQPGTQTAYMRVVGGAARVLLTIYSARGAPSAPEVIIRLATAPKSPEAATAKTPDLASLPLSLLVHLERIGDVAVPGGRWAGTPGNKAAVEGFSVTPDASLEPIEIEYQAVLGIDWRTPWAGNGAFCGSRGLSLPLLGIAIRLSPAAAASYTIAYWGSFGGQEIGPVSDGAICAGEGGPLEALRVTITRKAVADQP